MRILKNLLREAGHTNGIITSTYRDAADQASAVFANLLANSSASYGAYGQKVVAVYRKMTAGKQRKWIAAHAESIIDAMTDEINLLGAANVSHHAINPALLNVIDIGPGTSKFTVPSRQLFMCAALGAVDLEQVSAFYGPRAGARCKPPVNDPAFHFEIVP